MDDLKAKIKPLIDKLRAEASRRASVTGREIFTMTDPIMDALATHAAEPAPVAVEGLQGPPVEWVKNHPETAAKLIKDQANRIHGFAPTGNTALVEADAYDAAARAIESMAKMSDVSASVEVPMSAEERLCSGLMMLRAMAQRLRQTAALSQPAASQPTPEVEALTRINAITEASHPATVSMDIRDIQRIAHAALARGSVAEKGER